MEKINFEKAKEWILQTFTEEKVCEMFDEEVCSGNWIDREQMEEEGFENEYDYYLDFGRGEAEGAVMDMIIKELELVYELDFVSYEDETNLYMFLKTKYDCLNNA